MKTWTIVSADDDELHDILVGKRPIGGWPWPYNGVPRLRGDEISALISDDSDRVSPPACLVVPQESERRLFGRYAQLRSELSPLTAWTHVLTSDQFKDIRELTRQPDLGGLDAAWVGLTIAEALLLSDRSLVQLKLAGCLATSSFAVARSRALWPNENIGSVLERYDQSHKLIRSTEAPALKLRSALKEIWEVLSDLSMPLPRSSRPELRNIRAALLALIYARKEGINEFEAVASEIGLAQADRLRVIASRPAEIRVKEFDRLIDELEGTSSRDDPQRNQLFFLAGFLATVAAGGSPSLSLAEKLASRYPQITAWAYVIGGIGEEVTWTSAFDGLGRLVAREMKRPLRLDDSPTCDFSLSEAAVLIDRALQDPLVHLRIKQLRVLTVGIFPGVNIAIPLNDANYDARTKNASPSKHDFSRMQDINAMQFLARTLAPYLLDEISALAPQTSSTTKRSSRSRTGRNYGGRLPLDDDE